MANKPGVIDLGKLFQSVTTPLAKSREILNQADTYNHDHGNNMVNNFELIARAIKEGQGADPAAQLAYAADMLRQQKSGSAQLYARGLSKASQQLQGQQVTAENALTLIQSLLGGGQTPDERSTQMSSQVMYWPPHGASVPSTSINFQWKPVGTANYWLVVRKASDGSPRVSKDLGNVNSSMESGFPNDGTQYKWTVGVGSEPGKDAIYWTFTNGEYVAPPQKPQPQQQPQQQQGGGINDIIGSLIRGQQQPQANQQQPGGGIGDIIGTLIRGQQQPQAQQQQPGGGINDIIGSLIRGQQQPQGQQQSQTNVEAIVNALVSNSAMAGSYRSQSGSLVANALITSIQGMLNK
jgi:hypothetical protein